jgi:hypothetical protein
LTVQGYALFPEVLSVGNNKKYNRYALWLATQQGVVNTNVRDSFSAGGRVNMPSKSGVIVSMPAAFGRIKKYHVLIQNLIEDTEPENLMEYWEVDSIADNRMRQWCQLVAAAADSSVGYSAAWSVLSCIFLFIDEKQPRNKERLYDPACLSMVAERTASYGRGTIVTCGCCGRQYRQCVTRQIEGFRDREYDICPYCREANGSSVEEEYFNNKL